MRTACQWCKAYVNMDKVLEPETLYLFNSPQMRPTLCNPFHISLHCSAVHMCASVITSLTTYRRHGAPFSTLFTRPNRFALPLLNDRPM